MMDSDVNMGKRGAVPITKSGLSVVHSGPELREGPTTPVTADRKSEACPPDSVGVGVGVGVGSAVSQRKSGRESEGGAISATSAASGDLRSDATQTVSSLDPYKNNRNERDSDRFDLRSKEYALARIRERHSNVNLLGRNQFCGLWVVTGQQADGTKAVVRLNCKCWDCSYCGPRKAKRYKHAIRVTAEANGLARFVTLTLDPSKLDGEDTVLFINRTFAKWRVSLKRKFGVIPKYIRILEFQKNGNAHFHLLIDRYVPEAWIKHSWSAVGGGRFVDIRYVDLHRISRYLSKYLTKELLLSAPKRARRVTTSRSLHLIEKKKNETSWTLLKTTIFFLYSRLYIAARDVLLDNEGILESFSIVGWLSQTI
jgi:hypothetical protein